MRRLFMVVAASTVLVVGCGLVKKKKPPAREGDEGAVTDAPTMTVGGTGAKNEKDVLRYAKETPLSDEPGVIGKDGVRVKTFPGTGADVATLSKGTAVVKKAKFFSTGVLVLFDDPAEEGTKLMGWIAPEALAAPSASTAASAAPPAPTLVQPKVAVDAGGPKDAGAVADAGKVAVADAGKVATADAGAAPASALLQVLPTAGKCPVGFILVSPFCRRPCAADRDCPTSAFCTLGAGGKKTCSATR